MVSMKFLSVVAGMIVLLIRQVYVPLSVCVSELIFNLYRFVSIVSISYLGSAVLSRSPSLNQ